MIGFVALVWLWAAWKGNNEFSFDNVTWKTGWMIPVALFCLWWPMSLKTALPDFKLHYLYDGGSALAFCPMTPVFLTLLVLSRRGVNRVVLRVTAMVGVIIGCYNIHCYHAETMLFCYCHILYHSIKQVKVTCNSSKNSATLSLPDYNSYQSQNHHHLKIKAV